MLSYARFGHVDYSGTFFIADRSDDDIAGIVFGYQSNRSERHFNWHHVAEREMCKSDYQMKSECSESNLTESSQMPN